MPSAKWDLSISCQNVAGSQFGKFIVTVLAYDFIQRQLYHLLFSSIISPCYLRSVVLAQFSAAVIRHSVLIVVIDDDILR